MTLLSSHLAESSLGEKCASYLDYVAGNIPVSLHALPHRFASTLLSTKAASPLRSLTFLSDWRIDSADSLTVIFTFLACAIAIVAMSWQNSWSNFWRRPSSPQVSDRDYSYITPDDIVDPPSRPYDSRRVGTEDDDSEPDTVLLKHLKTTYALNFPAYTISEGTLSVGDLRQRAATVTDTPNPEQVKLLYKGKLLDDDSVSCRSQGLKQQSEVLCVVSGVSPGDSDMETETGPASVEQGEAEQRKRVRNRNKKNKNKNKNKTKQAADAGSLPSPAEQQRPASSAPSQSSSLPAQSPNLKNFPTALAQANALHSYLRTELVPLCDAYIANLPTDPKSRDFEHKKLSETILAQVILKADGIEPDGNDDARAARRALVKDAQATLHKLDKAVNPNQ